MEYKAPYGSVDPDADYVDKDVPGAVAGSKVPRMAIEGPLKELANAIDYFLGNGTWRSGQSASDLFQVTKLLRRISRGMAVDFTVKGWQNAPPGSPAENDLYIVGAAPTGAWAGQANKIAQYIGAEWAFSAPVAGLQVQYWSARQIVIRFDGANWAEDLASDTAAGRVELATVAETKARTAIDRAVTPAGLGAILGVGWRGAAAFSTPGTTAFAIASYGLTTSDKILAMLWGAGGGGASAAGSGGAGGSAGGFSLNIFQAQDATITIGSGGAGNSAGSNGGAGGTTSFGSVFSASGGNGGSTGLLSGGLGSGGLINLLGGSGEDILNIDSIMHWASGGAAPLLGLPGFLGVGAFGYANGGAAYYRPSGGNVANNGGNGLAIIVY